MRTRMYSSARTWAIFIVINVVVSAAVMVTILLLWDRTRTPVPATPTSALTAAPTLPVAQEASDVPIPTAVPVASPTAPPLLLYTVQEGDTLGGIAQAYGVSIEDVMAANALADPNTLHVGQTLVIPANLSLAPTMGPAAEADSADGALPTPPENTPEAPTTPSPPPASVPTPLPTLTLSGPPLVEIGQALGSGNLEGEVVILRNRGGAASLEGWTLSDAEGHTFTFPALILFTDGQVRLHSATGDSTPTDLYWGRAMAAWKGGTLITLRDAAGNVVDTYIVP